MLGNRKGFSLVEMMISVAISAVLIIATWMVVSSVIKSDEDSRVRLELQLEASSALRKISDTLRMAGPTGTVTGALNVPNGDFPVFAMDQTSGGFPNPYLSFLNSAPMQTSPSTFVTNDGVGHLAPVGDPEGYYGPSNEIAFKLPRPAPWYYPGGPPPGLTENPVDGTGLPVDLSGAVTWGVTQTLYNYYLSSPQVPGASPALADRQTDVYAIVLVPTPSTQTDAAGNPVPGPNQLELREFSAGLNGTPHYFIRKTVLAYNVERIVFAGPPSPYYLCGPAPDFQDPTLGMNQLKVTIWMWKTDMNKKGTAMVQAFKAKQSITINLRSVGKNQN